MNILDKIMKPRSIAVVGASTKQHTIGSDIMKRLREYGYAGPVYPVNPKGGVIEGLPAYATVLDIPGEVDLAVIIVNARFVLQTIDQCHEKGIKGLCVISAGFKETGTEGARLEAELLERVRRYGMRCVGPNCLGARARQHRLRLPIRCARWGHPQHSPRPQPRLRAVHFDRQPGRRERRDRA